MEKVKYKDRNYIVYKGITIPQSEIEKIVADSKYRYDDEITETIKNKNTLFIRNNVSYNKTSNTDFFEYRLHSYKDYIYLYDFDIEDLMMQMQGEPLDANSEGLVGGSYELEEIFKFAELNEENFYELLPKLLYESNENKLAYLILKYYALGNLSYIIYNKKTDDLEAITIKTHDYDDSINYNGVYYTNINNDEQMISNNEELLSEFSSDIKTLPANKLYKKNKVREIKWR